MKEISLNSTKIADVSEIMCNFVSQNEDQWIYKPSNNGMGS